MPRIYKLSRAGLRLLYKIRHHKGHGIHSPFVFNLINRVIEEKTPYYKYEDITHYIRNNSDIKYKITKNERLSFRLVNYFEAKNIMEIGSGKGINTLYLTAPYSDISCICVNSFRVDTRISQRLFNYWERDIKLIEEDRLTQISKKMDCIYINLNEYKKLPDSIIPFLKTICYDKTFIIVRGIRTNKRSKTLWKNISEMEGRTAMLDLFNIGIIFFDKSLYRWNYQISF